MKPLYSLRASLRNWAVILCLITAFGGVMSLMGCGQGGGSTRTLPAATATVTTAPVPATTAPPPSTGDTGTSAAPVAPISASTGSAAGCSLTTYSPNFGAESDPASGTLNHLYHWNALPVQVYFVPGDYVTPDRKAQALAGFDWWALATGQPALYQETAQQSAASIVVQFEARGQTGYGAITEYHFNSKQQMLDATITFNMTYLTDIASIVPVAAHEFGHALGIAGHSNDHSDVMSSSPEVYTRTQLSTRDVNTMQTAYCGLYASGAGGGGSSKSAPKDAATTTLVVSCRFDGAARSARR